MLKIDYRSRPRNSSVTPAKARSPAGDQDHRAKPRPLPARLGQPRRRTISARRRPRVSDHLRCAGGDASGRAGRQTERRRGLSQAEASVAVGLRCRSTRANLSASSDLLTAGRGRGPGRGHLLPVNRRVAKLAKQRRADHDRADLSLEHHAARRRPDPGPRPPGGDYGEGGWPGKTGRQRTNDRGRSG